MLVRGVLLVSLLVAAGCERSSGSATRHDDAAVPGPRFPERPTTFPACAAAFAPRPDRDAAPMCYVRGGAYDVVPTGFERRDDRERVELDDFLIDQHEVTVEQFAKFLNEAWPVDECPNPDNLCRPENPQPLPPIVYRDGRFAPRPGAGALAMFGAYPPMVDAYCRWAGKEVPTYAQWDVAALVEPDGKRRAYPWGDEPDFTRMNCAERVCADGFEGAAPPGSLRDVSPWGIFDMAGNVEELVCSAPSGCAHHVAGGFFTSGSTTHSFQDQAVTSSGIRCAVSGSVARRRSSRTSGP